MLSETSIEQKRATEPAPKLTGGEGDYALYRSLSSAAVVGFVFGVLGLAALLTPWLLLIPLLGAVLGWRGRRAIREAPHELTGGGLATAAIILGTLGAAGSVALNTYIYATEVPEGYDRISFSELQPSRNPQENVAQGQLPQRAVDLDGQQVFIKGYVYPDGRSDGIQHFILVPDMGTCCFGGDPKLTDMIEVKLKDPLSTYYSLTTRKLAGTFHLNPTPQSFLGKVAVYQLEADYVQ